MNFEEWADKNINTNQSAYTAAKAGWNAALREAIKFAGALLTSRDDTVQSELRPDEILTAIESGLIDARVELSQAAWNAITIRIRALNEKS